MQRLVTLLTFALAVSAAAQTALPRDTARIHYQRSDTQYDAWGLHVWEDTSAAVTWDKPLKASGNDDYGVYWNVPLKPKPVKLGLIVHSGDNKDADKDLFMNLGLGHELWLKSGSTNVAYAKAGPFNVDAAQAVVAPATLAQAAPAVPAASADAPIPAGNARINYYRPDGKYGGWGLHVWDGAKTPTEWTKPLAQTGKNDFGVYWDVPTLDGWSKLNFIIHNGDDKDPGPDQSLPADSGNQAWIISGSPAVNTKRPDTSVRPVGDLGQQQALWLTRDTMAVKPALLENGALPQPVLQRHGRPQADPDGHHRQREPAAGALGGRRSPARPSKPSIRIWRSTRSSSCGAEDAGKVAAALRGNWRSAAPAWTTNWWTRPACSAGACWTTSTATAGPLGVTWAGRLPTLTVWAPTAQDVKALVTVNGQTKTVPMKAGVKWKLERDRRRRLEERPLPLSNHGLRAHDGKLETNVVTDPYSTGLTKDGQQSLVTDLNDPGAETGGLGQPQEAAAQFGGRPEFLRTACARLQRGRRHRSGRRARHVSGLHRAGQRRHEAPEGWQTRASRPCTCCRPSTSPRFPKTGQPGKAPATSASSRPPRGAAGRRRRASRTRTASTGATTRGTS